MFEIFNAIRDWNWAAIIEGTTAIWIAGVATLALHTWRHQSKAHRQSVFLDELTDSVHEFRSRVASATEMVRLAKIGITNYRQVEALEEKEGDAKLAGTVRYLKEQGEAISKRILELLEPARPSYTKIKSLVAKGQVLGLEGYDDCHTSVAMILWQFDRMQAFAVMIGSGPLNWDNPTVQQTLEKVTALEAEDVVKQLAENNVKLLEFVRANFQRIYR